MKQNRFSQWQRSLRIYNPRIDILIQQQAKLEEYKDLARQAIIPEKYDEIMKDITRTYQEIEIFQDERTMEMLTRLLFLWCNRNMDYRQGMNEIMGVIFYAYDFQQFEEEQREADLYWMFDAIMTHHKRLFDYTSKTPLENTQIIKQYLQIMQKLKTIDSELYNVFQENKISSELFLIRYIKVCFFDFFLQFQQCLLSREFEIDQVLEIWDHIFQYGNRLQLLDCIIISMFIEVKQTIFEIEYINGFEVYLLFQNYPKKDKYMQIVSRAVKIYCTILYQFQQQQNSLINNPELQKYCHGSIQIVFCQDNQYLLVSTSKFWFNVRQSINQLMIYQNLKELGAKDENIILMIPEDSACNRKNNIPGHICPFDGQTKPNLYKNVQLDYKKNDVNIKNWIDQMRGKYDYYTPQSKRLKMNKGSRFLMYLDGHGGDGYTKMQDTTYLLDFEMAKITREMNFLNRYSEAFLISDSCGAVTLYEKVEAPNMILLGSSSLNEKSYSNGRDQTLLVAKTDKFSFVNNEFLSAGGKLRSNALVSIKDQYEIYDPAFMKCHAKLILTNKTKQPYEIKANDFWRSKQQKPQVIVKLRNTNFAQQQFINMLGL